MKLLDPLDFSKKFWPDVKWYRQQREIIYSVINNDETIVPAGNMLGKDFVAAFIALYFFMSRHPCRVLTTSVDSTQLESVLWGEIGRFIDTASAKLPIIYNHLHVKKIRRDKTCKISYIKGRVAAKGEGMLGHHVTQDSGEFFDDDIPRTLFIVDEASGVDNVNYEKAQTWAKRTLVIGNPYPCTNFFYKGVKAGDVKAEDNGHYYKKVIKIRCQDSPNIKKGLLQEKLGEKPDNRSLIPGVMTYQEYKKRRKLFDEVMQCIGLDAEFFEGADTLLFPPEWLNRAEDIAFKLPMLRTNNTTLGVDPAEGGDNTVWTVVDPMGLVMQKSMKTPDTSVIKGTTLSIAKEFGVKDEDILFDRGGGGKEHADSLRNDGHPVRTVAFGESATDPNKHKRIHRYRDDHAKLQESEVKYVYKNRRAEMYGLSRILLNPVLTPNGFGIPAMYDKLRKQLAIIPYMHDGEGRLVLPPKDKKDRNSKVVTLKEIIGHSPDEADSFVLAVYGQFYESEEVIFKARAG